MSLISALIGSHQTSRAVGAVTDWNKQAANKIAESVAQAQGGMTNAVGEGNAVLQNVYNQQSDNLNPYLQAGQQGINSLSSMLQPGGELTKQFSYNPSDLQNEPGYQFQLQQGNKAVNNAHAAGGLAGSGSQSKALAQYNQGLAGTTYQNAYNRALTTFQTNRENTLKPLQSLINAGQTATGQFNGAAQNYGNNVSQNDIFGAQYNGNAGLQGARTIADIFQNIGNAKAGGSVKQGSIWGNFANEAGQALAAGFGG